MTNQTSVQTSVPAQGSESAQVVVQPQSQPQAQVQPQPQSQPQSQPQAQPELAEQEQLVAKLVALKAADILLTLIKNNQVEKNQQITFLEQFFNHAGTGLKAEAKIENISLWLVEHGYGWLADDFQQQLEQYLKQEIQPLVEQPLVLSKFQSM
jgi:hypothetical protein